MSVLRGAPVSAVARAISLLWSTSLEVNKCKVITN